MKRPRANNDAQQQAGHKQPSQLGRDWSTAWNFGRHLFTGGGSKTNHLQPQARHRRPQPVQRG